MSSHKNNYCGIGVMTGTSLDGVDLVCATFSDATPSAGHRSESPPPWSYEMHQAESLPLPDAWRERLLALPSQSASVLAQTHVDWGHFLGKTVADWIEKHALSLISWPATVRPFSISPNMASRLKSEMEKRW